MKKQLDILKEITANFSEEERLLMESNRFAYIFSKAWLFLKIGAEKYRKNDAFNQPPLDFDEEDLQILANGCQQVLQGIGMTEQKPFTDLNVLGFYALFRLFHLDYIGRETKHNYVFNGKTGALDCITFEHIMDGTQVVYYNFCESIFTD